MFINYWKQMVPMLCIKYATEPLGLGPMLVNTFSLGVQCSIDLRREKLTVWFEKNKVDLENLETLQRT